jgi:hypothetical protein
MFTATADLILPSTTTGSFPRPRWYDVGMEGRPLDTCMLAIFSTLGQWQIKHRHLSAALRKSFVLIGVICGIVWMLLTARTRRTPSLDA